MNLFTPLEPLRRRFLNGFVQFDRDGAKCTVIFEDVDGDQITIGPLSPNDLKECALSTDWPMENIIEILPTLRSPQKKKIFETLITRCALAFINRYLGTIELDPKTVAAYSEYAQSKGSPDTVDWAFAQYILDDVDDEE